MTIIELMYFSTSFPPQTFKVLVKSSLFYKRFYCAHRLISLIWIFLTWVDGEYRVDVFWCFFSPHRPWKFSPKVPDFKSKSSWYRIFGCVWRSSRSAPLLLSPATTKPRSSMVKCVLRQGCIHHPRLGQWTASNNVSSCVSCQPSALALLSTRWASGVPTFTLRVRD